ncbi:MAG: transposase [Acidobacteriaceae bacterium]|nr:transposase [Acidobacteriaceae bacterium]
MQSICSTSTSPQPSSGFSVVFPERILSYACGLQLFASWQHLQLGHPSKRSTSYRPEQRIIALLATLASGLKGIAPSNTFLRPNSAIKAWLDGRFPDQGTIHRWLSQTTDTQAAALRSHLHQTVHEHGRFWQVLWSRHYLFVDVDGQGLVARGQRFEHAKDGWLGDGIDHGYQRYVCYAADTREVLDEFLASGNKTLMSQMPQLLSGLDAVIPRKYRHRVVVRGDSHMGTIGNIRDIRTHGYHYLCPLQSWSAIKRLREKVCHRRGGWFMDQDSKKNVARVQFWVVPRWLLSGKGRSRKVVVRATVYCRYEANGKREWTVLVSDLKREKGVRLWQRYHERGGTIEEYNDQAERAYHLEVIRTSCFAGLNALHGLIAVCWNLTQWALEGLKLPPKQSPQAEPAKWQEALKNDLEGLQERAAHSGLRLDRSKRGAVLEVQDTAQSVESAIWYRWLQQPIQLRLPLTG